MINKERGGRKGINEEIGMEEWTTYFKALLGGVEKRVKGEGNGISREEVNEGKFIVKIISSCYRYGTGTLTGVFLERVFQECLTYEGEMDYKTYLDFVLALENRHEPQSLHYLFRILDINNKGYLDTFCLNYFFRVSMIIFKIFI